MHSIYIVRVLALLCQALRLLLISMTSYRIEMVDSTQNGERGPGTFCHGTCAASVTTRHSRIGAVV